MGIEWTVRKGLHGETGFAGPPFRLFAEARLARSPELHRAASPKQYATVQFHADGLPTHLDQLVHDMAIVRPALGAGAFGEAPDLVQQAAARTELGGAA